MANVTIPKRFFIDEALREYYDVPKRLIQEIVQNSRDAFSSLIEITFTDTGYTIRDNGNGMDKQTLLDGLLTLGGSIKVEGNTGAFGAAKKLVLFAHQNYSIKTRDLVAHGTCLEYELLENQPFFDGTEISCEFFPDFCSSAQEMVNNAISVLAKCDFSNSCRVIINGEEFTDWMNWPGATILETDWCLIKTKPGNGYVYIRKNGIYSFNRYTSCKKDAIIELKPPSRELFSQSRDSLRPPYSSKLDAVCAEMSKGESTFGLPGIREFVYLGRNRFIEFVNKIHDSSEEAAQVVRSLGDILAYQTVEQRKMVVDSLSAFHSSVDQEQLKQVNEEMCEELQDLFVVDLADSPYTRPPDKYNPKSLPKKFDFLAKLWKTTIKNILSLSENSLDFQIGFTLDKECKALYSKKKDSDIVRLLINPETFEFSKDYEERFWAVFISALEEVSHAITYQKDYQTGHCECYNSHKNRIMEKVLPQISWRAIWKEAQNSTL